MLAMIASVGGTAEPIITSIRANAPQFVCFYASEGSIDKVAEIKQSLSLTGVTLRERKVLVANAEDLLECYEKGIEAGRLVEAEGYKPDEIIVDITGGTKTMSVGLGLATVARGYRYSYVGGLQRNKAGLGTVVTGTEMVRQALNPWDLLAIRERERIEWTFNTFHYDVALSLVQDLRARGTLNPRWQALLSGLEPLIKAYMHWDRFEHKEIGDLIKTGIERLMLCKQAAEWSALTPFIEAVSENKRFYDSFREASGGFRPDRLCDWHLADLVGNARRRVSEGKYDDATARLYRALEMKAQLALLECDPPLNSSCVTPDQVPTKIRDEFTKRYQDERSGMLKLPLSGAYRLLLEVGHPAGNRFFENRGYFDKILSARNDSILAHGITVQRKDSCESFLKLLEPMLSVTPPTFPQIEFAESRVAVPG